MFEPLFRAKKVDNGEWVYGGVYIDKESDKAYIITHSLSNAFEVDRNTLCAYIGLTDVNNKMIFENDIVICDEINEYTQKSKVTYGVHDIYCCGCCYDYHRTLGFYFGKDNADDEYEETYEDENTFERIEVIGNVFDNVGLLEENDGYYLKPKNTYELDIIDLEIANIRQVNVNRGITNYWEREVTNPVHSIVLVKAYSVGEASGIGIKMIDEYKYNHHIKH
jgi:uncharacterized phage protein (TIGR01671 family)